MIQCGVGVGVGWSGGGRPGPSWLANALSARYSTDLVGLVVGDDLVTSGADVTSWPLRVGAGALANLTANRFGLSALSNGRKLIVPNTVDTKALGIDNAVAWKCVIAVAYGSPAVNAYETIAAPYTGDEPLTRNGSTSIFYGGTWSRSVDGDTPNVTKSIPASGLHLFHSYYASSTVTGFRVGGSAGGPRTWPVGIAAVAWLAVTPSAGQIAGDVVDFNRYYSGLIGI